ncbi:MAG: sulfotransferase [Candidatus Aminicenantes bacterium]|nr:sulfotransferase [Candidatus Aminicenantes bacterium]
MEIFYKATLYKLPDFLIIGTARAGTTFLYQALASHEQIFLPQEKEPMFFSSWNQPVYKSYKPDWKELKWIIYDLAQYHQLFERAKKNQLLGECSTWYLYNHKITIENIKRFYGEESLSFEEATAPQTLLQRSASHLNLSYDYLGFGFYSHQVKEFLDSFPQVKIFIFEKFFLDLEKGLRELCDFLGLSKKINPGEYSKVNISGKPKNRLYNAFCRFLFAESIFKEVFKPFLSPKYRQNLKIKITGKLIEKWEIPENVKLNLYQLFKQDIAESEEIIQEDLSCWNIK